MPQSTEPLACIDLYKDENNDHESEFFSSHNKGLYGVWIRKITSDDNSTNKFSAICLISKFHRNIEEIKTKERYRTEVIFKFQEDAKSQRIPSATLCISFIGQKLPFKIFMFNLKADVKPYVSCSMQCFKFGRVSKSYKGKEKCMMYGTNAHPSEGCKSSVPRCCKCSSAHKSNDIICEKYKH